MNRETRWPRSSAGEFRPGKDPDVELVASECDLYGHDYEVIDGITDLRKAPRRPKYVFCPRCGMSWKVER